jgi:ABC-type amino acid transport substrate-binding protein
MTNELEPRLRAWLAANAPPDVPPDLVDRVRAIPRAPRHRTGPRLLRSLGGTLPHRSWAGRRRGPLWWLVAAALLAALVAGAIVAGALIRERVRPDLLDLARDAGTIEVAISREFPQVQGRDFNGFDVSIAADLTRRMNLHAEVTPADRVTALAGGSWTVALPSTRIGAELADRWTASEPYYHWPISVVVPAASDARSLDDLVGLSVCAVAGTTGEAWLTGHPDNVPLIRPDDAACLEALATGTAAAAVTADLGPADIKVRGDIRALGPPVTSEPRSVLVDRQAGDPTALIHEIDGAIASARDDGTLADLSRRYFGGYDLTVAPAEPQETSR